MILETIAGLGDKAIDTLITTAAAAMLGLAVAIVMAPLQIKKLRKDLKSRDKRIFPKIKRIEDFLLDSEIKQHGKLQADLLVEMRADQRDDADQRDASDDD